MHLSVCCRPMDCDRLLLYGSRLPLPTNCRRARHQLRLPASVTGWTRHQCSSSSSHGRKPKNQVKFDLVSSFLSFSLCFLVSPKVLRSTFSFQLFTRLTGDADRRGPRCITIQRSSAGFGFTLRHFIVYPPDSVSVSDVAILDHLGVNELRERKAAQVASGVKWDLPFFLNFFSLVGSTSKSARPRVCLERESHSRQKKERERERRNARVTIYPLLQAGGSRIVKGPDREKASWRKLLRLAREREKEGSHRSETFQGCRG